MFNLENQQHTLSIVNPSALTYLPLSFFLCKQCSFCYAIEANVTTVMCACEMNQSNWA